MKRETTAGVVAGAAAATLAGLAWWSLWHEPRSVRVKRRTIRPPGWPPALDGLRVAVVADLHTGAPHVDERRLALIVRRLNRERPDLAALLGDYVDPVVPFGTEVAPEDVAAVLAGIDAPLGRYAVLGNHDWNVYGQRMPAALRAAGIAVLENESALVPGAATTFWIAGAADAKTRRPDLRAALERVPSGDPVILLTHNPDLFPGVPARVSLTLAGHTHGAQVDLPVLRDRLTPSRHGAHYTKGHQVEGGRHLFVSPGVGTSRFPIRFRARPEVTVLCLESGS